MDMWRLQPRPQSPVVQVKRWQQPPGGLPGTPSGAFVPFPKGFSVSCILIATALEDNPGLALEHPGPGGISEQLRVHEVEDADDEREEEEEEEEEESVGSFSGENI